MHCRDMKNCRICSDHHPLKTDIIPRQTIARALKWKMFEAGQGAKNVLYPKCDGYHSRKICVYGLGDLGWVNILISLKKSKSTYPILNIFGEEIKI